MAMKTYPNKQNRKGCRAQTMVEFAIVMPLLLALLIGIFEFGRMIFIYAVVTNASRESVRFASAIGFSDNTYYPKYQYCAGIRAVAKKYGFLLNLQDSDIRIYSDTGPSTTATEKCTASSYSATNDSTIVITMGKSRATVTVTAHYSPMVKFIPITTRDFIASSARTIAGNVDVGP
jgi:Flp pilus assembly protein TadG